MYWTTSTRGDAADISDAYEIVWIAAEKNISVVAKFYGGRRFELKKFSTAEEAKSYLADLADKLNGGKNYVD